MAQSVRTWMQAASLAAGVILLGTGCGTTRNIRVETTPPGATVTFDGKVLSGRSPVSIPNVPFTEKNRYRIHVEKENYQAQDKDVDFFEARQAVKSSSEPWILQFTLSELRREVPLQVEASVEGFALAIDGTPAASPTNPQTLVFLRPDANSEWNKIAVRVDKLPSYKPKETILRNEDIANLPKTASGVARLVVELDEIRREVPVEIKANVEGAAVSLDEQSIGVTPLKRTFVFTREDNSKPWSTAQIRVQKEGYEYRPPGAVATPVYSRRYTYDELIKGVTIEGFVPVRFHSVPMRSFEIVGDKLQITTNNVSAEVSMTGVGEPPSSPIVRKDQGLILTRMSIVPGSDKLLFSLPKADRGEIVGANIVMAQGVQITPMTEGREFAIDPFVTADSKWIYFSSDRLRTRAIWRMPADGRGGFTKITGELGSVDTEPALSPDTETARLTYTSRLQGASLTTPPYIWTANLDGTLPTQVRPGQSPAWSPDGKKIAYVSPEHKIWTMSADGSNPTQLTKGDSKDYYPIWVPPAGKHIVYVSDQALNDLKERNLDIWVMTDQGANPVQLTTNGSLDSAPIVSSDGKLLYFFSNRGAQKEGEENLQIFRLELNLQ